MKILHDQWTYLECMSNRQTDIFNYRKELLLMKIVQINYVIKLSIYFANSKIVTLYELIDKSSFKVLKF